MTIPRHPPPHPSGNAESQSVGVAHAGVLQVSLLGLVEYDAMLGLQEAETYAVSDARNLNGTLFLCEHPPGISVGRQGSQTQIQLEESQLSQWGVTPRWVSRGGGAISHGPGQLAILLLIPLERQGIGVLEFKDRLETAVLETCQELKLYTRRDEEFSGIWSNQFQIASFGAAVKSGVSQFGMYLNVSLDPEILKWTQTSAGSSESKSLQSLRLAPFQMSKIRECLIRHISGQFGYTSTETSSGHPLLRRSSQRVLIHA